MNDRKLVKWLLLLLLFPLGLALYSEDRFRYPCQDPSNWDKEMCKMPVCDVRRECPEHIFKGQRDPRLGPPKDGQTQIPTINPVSTPSQPVQGANCGK